MRRIASGLLLVLTTMLVGLPSCTARPGSSSLQQAMQLRAPTGAPALWAVAPLANESGTTAVDRVHITDLLTEQLQQVQGINTVPVNRVLLAMQTLRIRSIATAEQASRIMDVLGIDGLVVGTITSWDPYQPPKLGLAVQLFTAMDAPAHVIPDPQSMRTATTETPQQPAPARAMAQAAGIWDASNHHTLATLQSYAQGRTRLNSAYGPDLHLVDMDLYTQFVAYQLVKKLLRDEQNRLTAASTP
ncbi:MAG: hypothetical protein MK095_06245 [Phycisphaerales bacterium]|nr:hypothetical protein [Phycisphaerales bacterium]